jgi:hypothetical protein
MPATRRREFSFGLDHIMPFQETIKWIDTLEQLPDDDLTVLIWSASSDQGVWIGYMDADEWRFVDGSKCLELVTHWAELPKGPN